MNAGIRAHSAPRGCARNAPAKRRSWCRRRPARAPGRARHRARPWLKSRAVIQLLRRRIERQLGNAKRFRLLLRRQDVVVVEGARVGGGTGQRLPPGRSAGAGQRIERRDRALDRCRVGVLADAGPRVIGEPRPAREQRVGRASMSRMPSQVSSATRSGVEGRDAFDQQLERGCRRDQRPSRARIVSAPRSWPVDGALRVSQGTAEPDASRRTKVSRTIGPQRIGAQETSGARDRPAAIRWSMHRRSPHHRCRSRSNAG